jgi:hypothetical protein
MQLNPAEISELIKSRIEGLAASSDIRNQGTVVSVTDGICRIHCLSDVMQGEMLEFPAGSDGLPTYGLALNLERDSVGSVILGEYEHISEGDTVKCTGRILEVPVGPELRGRVVNALGQPIDGKGPINAKMTDVIEKVAPGVIARKSVDQPMQTGSLVTAKPARLPLRLMPSSTKRVRTLPVFTSRLAKRHRPSRTWCAPWSKPVPWNTPLWWPQLRLNRLPCSTFLPTLVAPWVSTSAIAVKTP